MIASWYENIEKIVAAYSRRESVQHFTKLVPNSDIAALNAEIERIVAHTDMLRREISAIIVEIAG